MFCLYFNSKYNRIENGGKTILISYLIYDLFLLKICMYYASFECMLKRCMFESIWIVKLSVLNLGGFSYYLVTIARVASYTLKGAAGSAHFITHILLRSVAISKRLIVLAQWFAFKLLNWQNFLNCITYVICVAVH